MSFVLGFILGAVAGTFLASRATEIRKKKLKQAKKDKKTKEYNVPRY